VETFTAFLFSVVAGARRVAHTSLLRADVALHVLLGITRFPVDDTFRNLFKRFGQRQCQRFFSACGTGSWSGCRKVLADIAWIWTRPCSSATVGSRGRCAGPTRASMDGPRIIRWWRCWPEAHFLLHGWLRSGGGDARRRTAENEAKLRHRIRRGAWTSSRIS
jgi:hypothetical protein